MQRVRIFISSPGDVGREREAAAKVIARVGTEFAQRAVLEPYFWEHEPMHAGADFQGQIPPPAQFHIFVGILWSRLGSRLHSQHVRPDGSCYQSGTEYEFETALEAYRKSERHTPRILIYRRTEIPSFPAEPLDLRNEREAQWEALKSFVEHWFNDVTDGGTFKAAFNTYANTADFEERLEMHLRKLLNEFAADTAVEEPVIPLAPTWTHGSPYRGLKTFEFEHAAVFFGRTRSVDQVIGQLADRAREEKCPFVLIFGSSGSGKSSLLRAGVLPAIVNGAVDGIGLWRRAMMQPSRTSGDLFDGLAAALTQESAVPELLVGGITQGTLAQMLRTNAAGVGMLLGGALPQIAQREHEAEKRRLHASMMKYRADGRLADAEYGQRLAGELRYPEPRLILGLDQLEEIFTNEERFSEANRAAFFRAICSLLESNFVWIVATLRSDFFARCEELPDLVRLKNRKGQFHLLPPNPTELAQIIRLPAQAAGVQFEDHPTRGRLEDLLRDAALANAGSLPLLEFALEALFNRGSAHGILTYVDYAQLSGAKAEGEGLRGILVNVAEEVYGRLSNEARGAFAKIFLGLATIDVAGVSDAGTSPSRYARRLVRPAASLERSEREVYDMMVQARLLVADADVAGREYVTVAHEALLNEWPRLRNLLDGEARYLRMRSRISLAASQWLQEQRDPARLATGVTLAEGREVIAHGMQLDPGEREYIRLSVQKSRRRYVRAAASAAFLLIVFACLTWAAVLNAREASRRKSETQRLLALSDLGRAQEFLDQKEADNALVYLARASKSLTEIAQPAAERLWFALTQRIWSFPTSSSMRHDDAILSTAVSPNGEMIVTASRDCTARIWSADTGKPVIEPLKFRKFVRTVCFSPDNHSILTGTFDGSAILWRFAAGKGTAIWTAKHPNEVTASTFAPSGRIVITGCRDGVTRVWSADDGHTVGEFGGQQNVHTLLFQPGSDDRVLAISANTARLLQISQPKELHAWKHNGEINTAAFTADGKLVATAGDSPFLQIWDTNTGMAVGKPILHEREVTDAHFNADGTLLATVSGGHVFVWKIDGSPAFEQPLVTAGSASLVRFSPDGLRIYTGTDDGKVQTWNATNGALIGEPVRERAQIVAAIPRPDNLHLVVTTAEGSTRTWLMPTATPPGIELHHPGAIEMMSTSVDGQRIVTVCRDGKARVWNSTDRFARTTVLSYAGSIVSSALTPDGRYIVTGGADATLRLWKGDTGEAVGQPVKLDTTVSHVRFSPAGDLVAAGSEGGMLRLYALPDLARVREQTNHKSGVRALHFDGTGTRMAIGWTEGIVEVQTARSGQLIGEAIQAGRDLTSLDVSPDGKLVATGTGGGRVQLWHAGTSDKAGSALAHKAAVGALIFSPNGRLVVSGSDDGTAVIWNTGNGKPVSAALLHGRPVCSLAISRDSMRLATGTEDGTVRIWDTNIGQPISERVMQSDSIRGLAFGPNAETVANASADGTVRITNISTKLNRIDYLQLAEFARAIASVSLDDSGRLTWRERPTIGQLREFCRVRAGGGNVFCDWFFADRTARLLTPFASWTVRDYVVDLLKQGRPDAIRDALLISAGNPGLTKEIIATAGVSPR